MWVVSLIGAFSIVAKPWDVPRDTLTVRARVKEDLDHLRAKYLPDLGPTQFDAHADYHYRAVAPREAVMSAMAALVGDTAYADFKSEVGKVQGSERALIYSSVWSALRRLQTPQLPPGTPIMYANIGRRPDILDSDDDVPLRDDPSKRST